MELEHDQMKWTPGRIAVAIIVGLLALAYFFAPVFLPAEVPKSDPTPYSHLLR